jgi:hypothetical protein
MALLNKIIAAENLITGPGPKLDGDSAVTFERFISQFIGVLTIIAIIYFTIQIIFTGYAFMSSNGDPKKMEQAKLHLTQNILGLTIVLVALILTTLIGKLFGLGNILEFTTNFNKIFPPTL